MLKKEYSPVWSEKFQVRSYDIGLMATMRMNMVCSYFQEIAGRHANHLDIGYQHMQQEGKVWMLSRIFMNINKMPVWGQEFHAETWPLGVERIFYRRDYRLVTDSETLITACSYWLLIDLESRKPTVKPIDEEVLKKNAGQFAMTMPQDVFHPLRSDMSGIHVVQYSDLDQNRHVNNARYVEWIFNLVDLPVLEEKQPAFFGIEYKQEVRAGDTVHLYMESSGKNDFMIEGRLRENNQVCFRSRIIFKS